MTYADRRRFRFERWKFVLNLLSVFSANLDEGMNCADSYVKANSFAKNANDVAIRATLAPQLADQFAVSFEFGARRFLRDRFQQGKVGSMIFRLLSTWPSQSVNSPITRLHSPIRALERYPYRLISISYEL